jgi:MscS family membrane protein
MDSMQAVSGYLETIGLQPWVVQVFVIVLTTLIASYLVRVGINRLRRTLGERTKTVWDDSLIDAVSRPAQALIWIVGLAFAVSVAEKATSAPIFGFVGPLRDVAVIAVIAWFLVRFIREAEANLIAARRAAGEPFDRTTFDAIAKLLRLSVIITASLVILQTLGYSVSGVLAFGGIGGIAVGFAAKDMLSNFFGGLVIYLDRPFAVGDWVRSPDRDIEGTVEVIGWRQTIIRTFDSRPLYVPNSAFTNISVENPSRMQNRRIYEYFGVRYQDAAQVEAIVRDVDKMVRSHPGHVMIQVLS